jgi:hypothetical protein
VGQRLDDPPWISRAPDVTPREVDWGGGISPRHTVGHVSRGPNLNLNAAGMLAREEVMRASRRDMANTPRAKDRLDSILGMADTPRAKDRLDSILARRHSHV